MPPKLGEFFPKSLSDDFILDFFKVGALLKFYCTTALKEKRFVYIADRYDGEKVALLFINSEINTSIFPTVEAQSEHYKLERAGRPYLDWDSYVDCTKFKIEDK
jgi:hypothetical protein